MNYKDLSVTELNSHKYEADNPARYTYSSYICIISLIKYNGLDTIQISKGKIELTRYVINRNKEESKYGS